MRPWAANDDTGSRTTPATSDTIATAGALSVDSLDRAGRTGPAARSRPPRTSPVSSVHTGTESRNRVAPHSATTAANSSTVSGKAMNT